MKKSRAKQVACWMLAAAILMGCFAACAGQPGSAASTGGEPPPQRQEDTAEPVAERPPLVEPEQRPAALENGDFEQYFDEYGELPGWKVTFSEWGEGENSASFGLSAEEDNLPNTSQKLSLYNGLAEPVDFTVSQTVEGPAAGDYVVACIFEGGPAGADTRTTLSVNGKAVDFGSYDGWKGWKQVVSEAFTVAEGGTVVIEISGTLNSKDWMDLDDVELTPAGAFRPRTFARSGGASVYDRLTNGDFETGEDANGLLPGWTVEFADWGRGAARAGYRLTKESDNFNTSQKLSLGNSTGKRNGFTITQQFLSPGTGQYVVALDWEAKLGPTDFALGVNGNKTLLGNATGWKNWGQNASAPFFARRGDVITIEISGTLENEGWLDIDNVIFLPAADFIPQRYPYYAGDPMRFVTMDHIQNGDFSEEVVWTYAGNPDGVTIRVLPEAARAGALAVLAMNPGYGPKSSEAFTVEQKTAVTVEVTFSLAGGGTAAIRNLQFKPAQTQPDNPPDETPDNPPEETVSVNWTGAEQTGGAPGTADTAGIALTFDKEIPGLTADAFTVTGAEKGALTDNGGGSYTLAVSGITVGDGERVTVAVASPAGYAIAPGSRTVTVYRKGSTWTAVPITNNKFSESSKESNWRLPTGWNVCLGGASITSVAELDAWIAAHPDSVFCWGRLNRLGRDCGRMAQRILHYRDFPSRSRFLWRRAIIG